MARSTYENIASLIATKPLPYSVSMPIEGGSGLIVYPPSWFNIDSGVEVVINEVTVAIKSDGYWIGDIPGDPTSEEVVEAIVDAIFSREQESIDEEEGEEDEDFDEDED